MEIRQYIIDYTSKAFVTKGIRSVSMDEIAQELGISKKTIYENFSSKEDLIEEVVCNLFNLLINNLESKLKEMEEKQLNAVEQLSNLLYIHQQMSQNINPLFLDDLKKYYPSLDKKRLSPLDLKCKDLIKSRFLMAQTQGFIKENINIDIFLMAMNKIKEEFSGKYLQVEVDNSILYPLFIGITTSKGQMAFVKFLENSSEPYFKSILNNLNI